MSCVTNKQYIDKIKNIQNEILILHFYDRKSRFDTVSENRDVVSYSVFESFKKRGTHFSSQHFLLVKKYFFNFERSIYKMKDKYYTTTILTH